MTNEIKQDWQPIETAPKDGSYIYVQQIHTCRWLSYKAGSQEVKRGKKGRWQIHNGYGWDNAVLEGLAWMPVEEASEVLDGATGEPIAALTQAVEIINSYTEFPDNSFDKATTVAKTQIVQFDTAVPSVAAMPTKTFVARLAPPDFDKREVVPETAPMQGLAAYLRGQANRMLPGVSTHRGLMTWAAEVEVAQKAAVAANPNEAPELRRIISDCLAALGNGSGADPEHASLDFLKLAPAEIRAVVAELRDARTQSEPITKG